VNADESKDFDVRIKNLIDSITKTMYSNVCRGLFEAHKLIYSFLISSSINKLAKILSPALFSILLKGATVKDRSKMPANPYVERISNVSWELAYYLDQNFEKF